MKIRKIYVDASKTAMLWINSGDSTLKNVVVFLSSP